MAVRSDHTKFCVFWGLFACGCTAKAVFSRALMCFFGLKIQRYTSFQKTESADIYIVFKYFV